MDTVVYGDAIKFVGGTYVGHDGWMDPKRSATKMKFPMIVSLGEGATKTTMVLKENVELVRDIQPPRCLEEAVLQQHLLLNKAMNALVKQFAQCGLESPNTMAAIFKVRLQRAIDKQRNLGPKAWLRPVVYDPENISS